MTKEFIIFEDSVHAQVFLAKAADEQQAWKLYLEHERNYIEQPDGTYRSRPSTYDSLERLFDPYGIVSHDDGSYSDTNGRIYQSLDEVKLIYNIEEQEDGAFISHDKSYPNLAETLRQTIGHHHFEIAQCNINLLAEFQTVFVSRDKWDYVEEDNAENLKSDIAVQHLWQAERYKTLGKLIEAVAELKKGLGLTSNRKEKVSIFLNLGWLLRSSGQFSASAKYYREALFIATEFDNIASIRYRLAEVYEEMDQPSKALWHYKRISLEDLSTEDCEKIEKRITLLQRTKPTTATA